MRSTASYATSTRTANLIELALQNGSGGSSPAADSGLVFVRPIDGVQDDWPTLMGVTAVAAAYKKIIVMLPGLHGEKWQCLSSVPTPSGTTIWGTPGTIIEQGIGSTLSTADCAFTGNVSGAATFTLQAAVAAGDRSIHLTTAPANGAIIGIFTPNGLLATVTYVTGVTGGAGNFTVSLGRPVMFATTTSGIVQTYTALTQDVRIFGNGMQIVGKAGSVAVGSAFINFIAGREIFVQDLILDAVGFTNLQISGGAIFDVGSYRCFLQNVIVKNVSGAGVDFAGCDACEAVSVTIQNCSPVGWRIEDTFNSTWLECQTFDCTTGADLTGSTVNGSFQNVFTDCIFEGNATGVLVENGTITANTGSNRNMFIGCLFNANTGTGISMTSGFETTLTGCQACFNGGVGVSNNAPNTVIANLIADSNTTSDIVSGFELNVSGFTSIKPATGSTSPQVDIGSGAILNMSNFNVVNLVPNGQVFETRTNATCRLTNGQVHTDGASGTEIAFQLDGAGSKLYLSNVRLSSAVAPQLGINGNTGSTTRLGSGVDLTTGNIFGINITTPGAFCNKSFKAGTVNQGPAPLTENGVTGVVIALADIRATDTVILSPESGTSTNTLGSVVVTPGTGFTYTGSVVGSNRVIEWRVEG